MNAHLSESWNSASLVKDEAWRFAQISRVRLDGFSAPAEPDAAVVEKYIDEARRRALGASGILVFVDERLVFSQLSDEALAAGARFEAASDIPFSTPPRLGMEALIQHHDAVSRSGFILSVPADKRFDEPFVVFRWQCSAGSASFPASRVEIGRNGFAKLCEFYSADAEADATLTLSRNEILVADGAEFSRDFVQALAPASKMYRTENVVAGENATVRGVEFCVGALHARTATELCADGRDVLLDWRALNVASGDQEIDWRTIQRHAAPGARSNLLCKNALLDRSRTIFSGSILVDKVAQQTNAVQSCRNLVLSEDAEAHSLPGLEIDANDVQCSHGATTGTLDADQLFYLLQRGLPEADARMLLTLGFMDEVINACAGCAVADFVREKIAEKFGTR